MLPALRIARAKPTTWNHSPECPDIGRISDARPELGQTPDIVRRGSG
jgi:hypothetical protein